METGLILGAEGMLGSSIRRKFLEMGHRVIAPTRSQLDITNSESLDKFFRENRPDWTVNCAAKHNLASCEKEVDIAMKVNCSSVGVLAQITQKYSSYLIHISTDYVFNGRKGQPYEESDKPDPVNRYGLSKFEGEKLALSLNENVCVVRVAALFGPGISRDKGGVSFVDRMREKLTKGETVTVTSNQIVSPTSTNELASQFNRLIREKPSGILHCVNRGFTSWYQLTVFIAQQLGITPSKVKELQEESGSLDGIERPQNSSLENLRLNELNLNEMQNWEHSVSDYLKG